MGEATFSTDPAHDKMAWPQRAFAQRGGKVAKYARVVIVLIRHLTIGYQLRGEPRMHV